MHLKKSGLLFLYLFILVNFSFSHAQDSLPGSRIFSPQSFWYASIPEQVELHQKSDIFVKEFLRQKNAYYGTVNINTTSWASPVYYVDANTLTSQVTEWDCQNKHFKDKYLAEQWAAVPIPDYAKPAKGTDAEMSIYQAATDTLWDFWQARKVNGKWQACWGGRITNASKNPGVFEGHYGTTATSLPFIGGQITAEELRQGEIKHVIGISLVDLERSTIFSWPAHRSDGYNPQNLPNRIPEGLRFRLDPSINVDKLHMHPVGKGFVIWDKAGAISLRAQNPYSYTAQGKPNPYDELFLGKPSYSILDGMPWDRLQFLPMNYGKPE